MNEKEAINWCRENQANVKFMKVYGEDRIQIRTGGSYFVERYDFISAVEAIKELKVGRK